MSTFAEKHSAALAQIKRAGGVLTPFTKGALTVNGYAVEGKSDVQMYAALKLTETEIKTLVWVPVVYGDEPMLGSFCTWGGKKYSLKAPQTYAADGNAMISQPVIARS